MPCPQEWHADLGLVDDDRTEDLRPKRNTPVGAATPPGLAEHPPIEEQES